MNTNMQGYFQICVSVPLIDFGCKFTCSFLVNTAQISFFGLDTTLSQRQGGLFVTLKQIKAVELFYENVASLSYFCHQFQFKFVTHYIFCLIRITTKDIVKVIYSFVNALCSVHYVKDLFFVCFLHGDIFRFYIDIIDRSPAKKFHNFFWLDSFLLKTNNKICLKKLSTITNERIVHDHLQYILSFQRSSSTLYQS